MYPPNGKCGDSEETDPDKLHDLKITLEQYQVYPWEQIDEFVEAFLNGADQSNLDPRLDTCVEKYKKLDEDRQVDFKSSAKAFTRLYAFLDAQLSWTAAELAIFLSLLIRKLPDPVEEDLSKGVLDAVEMESYRMEQKAVQSISIAEEDAEIAPVRRTCDRWPEQNLQDAGTLHRPSGSRHRRGRQIATRK